MTNPFSTLNAADLMAQIKAQLLPALQSAAPEAIEAVLDAELPKVFAQIAPFDPETHTAQVRFVAGGVDVEWVKKP